MSPRISFRGSQNSFYASGSPGRLCNWASPAAENASLKGLQEPKSFPSGRY